MLTYSPPPPPTGSKNQGQNKCPLDDCKAKTHTKASKAHKSISIEHARLSAQKRCSTFSPGLGLIWEVVSWAASWGGGQLGPAKPEGGRGGGGTREVTRSRPSSMPGYRTDPYITHIIATGGARPPGGGWREINEAAHNHYAQTLCHALQRRGN